MEFKSGFLFRTASNRDMLFCPFIEHGPNECIRSACSHAFDQNTSDRCLAQDNIEVTMFDDFLLLASASPFHWCISGEECDA